MCLKVQLVADEPQFRQALRALVERESNLVVVAESRGVADTPARLQRVRPDVIIIDGDAGDGGASALVEARRRNRRVRTLMLYGRPTPDAVQSALAAGASGVAGKVQSPRELLGAIRAVGRGGSYLCRPSTVPAAVLK